MNKENNLVSVVLPVYNSEETIEKSLESILNQTYNNIEILLIDDGSTDNSLEICERYEDNYSNVRLFKNYKNVGLTKSLNILINESKGEYICRQDADDVSLPTRIQTQITTVISENLDACTTRAKVLNKNRVIPNISFYLPLNLIIKFKNPFIHGSLFLKKDVLNKVGNYNEKFRFAQDYKLMNDLIKDGYKCKIIKEPLYLLNMENNISTTYSKEQKYFANCVRKNIEPIN